MIWQIVVTLLLAAASGWGYRFGGAARGQRWVRQVLDAICLIITLTMWGGWNWFGLLILGTIWITTTYFKINGQTNLFTWMLVGLSFGLLIFPYMIHHPPRVHWFGFSLRAALNTILVGVVVRYFGGNVQFSEGFRGAIQILTIPVVLI